MCRDRNKKLSHFPHEQEVSKCHSHLQSLLIKSSGFLVIFLGKSIFSIPLRIKLQVIIWSVPEKGGLEKRQHRPLGPGSETHVQLRPFSFPPLHYFLPLSLPPSLSCISCSMTSLEKWQKIISSISHHLINYTYTHTSNCSGIDNR